MGSGHVLAYAFDMFIALYRAEGYSEREASELIMTNNLFGLEIDKRAYQLAYFAIMMKGRQYSRRILAKNIKPNVYAVPDNFGIGEAELQLLHANFPDQEKAQQDLLTLVTSFEKGHDLGSLIEFTGIDFENLKAGMDDYAISFFDGAIDEMICVGKLLQQKYHIGITNPPYMGSSGMDKQLSDFVRKNYPDSKSDLFGVFMERLNKMIQPSGYYAMITQHAWMFLSSFEKLRIKINQQTIINMAHLGTRAFEEIGGEVVQTTAFVMSPKKYKNFAGSYLRLVDFANHELKETKTLEAIAASSADYLFVTVQDNFAKIPGQPISYWVSENLIQDFVLGTKMDEIVQPKVGLQTGDNDQFLKLWWEIDINKIKFDAHSNEEAIESKKKWFPYNKGGSFRRWYGNYDYVVNWENDGHEIKHFVDDKGKLRSRPQNTDYYFKEAITWSDITSGDFSLRFREYGSIHDVTGMSAFSNSYKDSLYLMGIMNSKIANHIFKITNPTMHLQIGNFQSFPVLVHEKIKIEKISKDNIELTRTDWDISETSWNHKKNLLI